MIKIKYKDEKWESDFEKYNSELSNVQKERKEQNITWSNK